MGRQLRDKAEKFIAWDHGGDRRLSFQDRYVLLALANWLHDANEEVYTADSVVAAKLHMSPHAYYRSRRRLMAVWAMARTAGDGQGSRRNRYRLFPTCPAQTLVTVGRATSALYAELDWPHVRARAA